MYERLNTDVIQYYTNKKKMLSNSEIKKNKSDMFL